MQHCNCCNVWLQFAIHSICENNDDTYLHVWALFVCEMTFPQPQTTHERQRDVIITDTEPYVITTINGCLFVCLHCPFGNENLWMTWLHIYVCVCGLVHLNSSFVCMKGSQSAIISAQMTFHRLSLIFLFLLWLLFWPVVAIHITHSCWLRLLSQFRMETKANNKQERQETCSRREAASLKLCNAHRKQQQQQQ